MPFSSILDGKRVSVFDYTGAEWLELKIPPKPHFVCPDPECGGRMTPAGGSGTQFRSFFRHFPNSGNPTCPNRKETHYHLMLKEVICTAAAAVGWVAETEVTLTGDHGQRIRIDVFCSQGDNRVAFEAQHSPQSLPEYMRRTAEYKAFGIPVIWLTWAPFISDDLSLVKQTDILLLNVAEADFLGGSVSQIKEVIDRTGDLRNIRGMRVMSLPCWKEHPIAPSPRPYFLSDWETDIRSSYDTALTSCGANVGLLEEKWAALATAGGESSFDIMQIKLKSRTTRDRLTKAITHTVTSEIPVRTVETQVGEAIQEILDMGGDVYRDFNRVRMDIQNLQEQFRALATEGLVRLENAKTRCVESLCSRLAADIETLLENEQDYENLDTLLTEARTLYRERVAYGKSIDNGFEFPLPDETLAALDGIKERIAEAERVEREKIEQERQALHALIGKQITHNMQEELMVLSEHPWNNPYWTLYHSYSGREWEKYHVYIDADLRIIGIDGIGGGWCSHSKETERRLQTLAYRVDVRRNIEGCLSWLKRIAHYHEQIPPLDVLKKRIWNPDLIMAYRWKQLKEKTDEFRQCVQFLYPVITDEQVETFEKDIAYIPDCACDLTPHNGEWGLKEYRNGSYHMYRFCPKCGRRSQTQTAKKTIMRWMRRKMFLWKPKENGYRCYYRTDEQPEKHI